MGSRSILFVLIFAIPNVAKAQVDIEHLVSAEAYDAPGSDSFTAQQSPRLMLQPLIGPLQQRL